MIEANLSNEGQAYFNAINQTTKSAVNFNTPSISIDGKKVKLKENGATMILEKGKSHILVDEVPELEI